MSRSLPRLILLTVLGLSLSGCPEDQVLTSTRNLSRPGPLALVCSARIGDGGAPTGLTASHCTSDAGAGGSVKGTLFGFVANTARGEVAVFRPGSQSERLVDLDPGSPGFGFIPVGSFPTDLEATRDGCRVATANSGSCDLSIIDVPSVIQVAAGELKTPTGAVVSSVIPRTAAGPLRARPQELVLIPPAKTKAPNAACSKDREYRAYVTFPRCNLVAEVDLTTGKVIQGVVLLPGGDYITKTPSCAVECVMRGDPKRTDSGARDMTLPDMTLPDKTAPDKTPSIPDGAPSDAGVADQSKGDGAPSMDAGPGADSSASDAGNSAAGTEVLPFGLAYSHEDQQLYVSSAGAGFISVIDIDPSSGAFKKVRRIQLGVATTRIKLSPKTRRLGRFLYVIARDRSVRVISTSTLEQCETNLDLAKAPEAGVPLSLAGCQARGDKRTLPRRVTADAPGLRFGSWIPQEIEFVTGPEIKTDASVPDAGPRAIPMQGVFAMIALSDGTVHVVNVEDWHVITATTHTVPALHLSHRLRNANQGTDLGLPKGLVESVTGAGTGGVPVVVNRTDKDLPNQGIYLRAPGESIAGSWNLIYEDRLLGRWSGSLGVTGDKLVMDDPGATYCASGVEARVRTKNQLPEKHGDILVVVGCQQDSECGIEQVCAKSVSNPSKYGLCLDKSQENEMYTKCLSFLNAEREYLVTRATNKQLTLDVLPVEPQKIIKQDPQTAKCTANSDCDKHFMCALKAQIIPGQVALAQGDCFRPGCAVNADCGSNRRCIQPLDGSPKVCSPTPLPLEMGPKCDSSAADPDAACTTTKTGAKCTADKDCKDTLLECRKPNTAAKEKICVSKGMKCARFAGLKDVCVRITPCFSELLRYDVRAGRSFLMGGYQRRKIDVKTGECTVDDSEDALMANRIPVGLPIYPVILGPRCNPASPAPLQTPLANPCFDEIQSAYTGYTSRTGTETYISVTGGSPSTVVRFSNPDIWFSLGVSHLTKPPAETSTSDAGTASATGTPPMPTRDLVIKLDVGSGFSALKVGSGSVVSLPVRLVEAPDGYVYIVDQGDTSGGTGNNGQVVRFIRSTALLDSFQVR